MRRNASQRENWEQEHWEQEHWEHWEQEQWEQEQWMHSVVICSSSSDEEEEARAAGDEEEEVPLTDICCSPSEFTGRHIRLSFFSSAFRPGAIPAPFGFVSPTEEKKWGGK
ncbi:hypothetical protein EYF80_052932 [Liparis tanakae]|uniref:Uncharacterized protein n=1 Tax=Liparis tanakae TaxID=230148 RepID=A0A4Z2F7M8_9TELE|nr:hypothetical protein EYF80_052932 [Liparis tanakae]